MCAQHRVPSIVVSNSVLFFPTFPTVLRGLRCLGHCVVMEPQFSGTFSYITRLLQIHAERVCALREEEAAINARAELLEQLADCLNRGEFPEQLAFPGLRGRNERGVGVSSRAAPHLSDALPEGPCTRDSRTEVACEGNKPTTPSPDQRELDDFFPVRVMKRSRRADPLVDSLVREKGVDKKTLTATDILSAIPCLSSSVFSSSVDTGDIEVLGVEHVGRPQNTHRQVRDYAASNGLFSVDGVYDGDGDASGNVRCTPSSYWEIDFPRKE
uniref:Uncharacterized protein n=1 Tax=Trypanosoma congolense (strain IL3000) TaxID=1068625 RepID=G0UTD0_TRYCI|nr:conserved hypothetical protein [Trypanosoma congolense IL3000]